jgi:Calcineurin-like phosphoesterase
MSAKSSRGGSTASNLIGGGGRLFANPVPGKDETSFQVDNTSEAYYNSPYFKLHQKQIQPVPAPTTAEPILDLTTIVGAPMIAAIEAAGKIAFHAVGDTGAAKVDSGHSPSTALAHQGSVADAMVADVEAGGPLAPSFFFHLGDLVYHFGEAQYYYDQFYEPYRAYDRPIIAVPGNHDGMVFGKNKQVPQIPTLTAFLRNFCAAAPGPSPDSGGLVRSVMTQPGVYFTLEAPFVSIIGLYSNVLDGPGVISSEGKKYPTMNDDQLVFLQAELTRLKPAHDAGQRAVLIAVHHPPVSADGLHGGTVGLAKDIDGCCVAAGFWPDAILSGHAHLYQRFSRNVPGLGRAIPYVVSGSGGFAATPPQKSSPSAGTTIGQYTLETVPLVDFGYLTLVVDMTGAAGTLTISYKSVSQAGVRDSVTLTLPSAGSAAAAKPAAAREKIRKQ